MAAMSPPVAAMNSAPSRAPGNGAGASSSARAVREVKRVVSGGRRTLTGREPHAHVRSARADR